MPRRQAPAAALALLVCIALPLPALGEEAEEWAAPPWACSPPPKGLLPACPGPARGDKRCSLQSCPAEAGCATRDCNAVRGSIDGEVVVRDAWLSLRGSACKKATWSVAECCALCQHSPKCNAWSYCNRREGCGAGCVPAQHEFRATDSVPFTISPVTYTRRLNPEHRCTDAGAWPYQTCTLKFVQGEEEAAARAPPRAKGAAGEGWVSGLLPEPSLTAIAPPPGSDASPRRQRQARKQAAPPEQQQQLQPVQQSADGPAPRPAGEVFVTPQSGMDAVAAAQPASEAPAVPPGQPAGEAPAPPLAQPAREAVASPAQQQGGQEPPAPAQQPVEGDAARGPDAAVTGASAPSSTSGSGSDAPGLATAWDATSDTEAPAAAPPLPPARPIAVYESESRILPGPPATPSKKNRALGRQAPASTLAVWLLACVMPLALQLGT